MLLRESLKARHKEEEDEEEDAIRCSVALRKGEDIRS